MNRTGVNDAIREARRFIERAEALLATEVISLEWDDETGLPKKDESGRYVRVAKPWWHSGDSPKQSGAARRASMDLTRALAAMRKP